MSYYHKGVEIKELEGKTISKINGLEKGSREVRIFTDCGKEYLFYHEQDCCESVDLEDFDGCADDLVGGFIVSAEEVSNEDPEGYDYGDYSHTWTFYKIETNKGGLWMRWLGESNGYYGESVDLVWANKPD